MKRNEDYLDCCSQPVLDTVAGLGDLLSRAETLQRCRGCAAYWYRKAFDHGEVEQKQGFLYRYVQLTADEAERLLLHPYHPESAHLAEHEGILWDGRRAAHVPAHPAMPT